MELRVQQGAEEMGYKEQGETFGVTFMLIFLTVIDS